MFKHRFFLTLWLTIGFFAMASVTLGQIDMPQQLASTQKTVPKRAVAIITFENLSSYPENDWIGAGFAESLTTKLSKLESLDLYERRQLNKVLTESGLNQQKVSEDRWEKTERIGKTLHLKGVQYVLIGSVAMLGSYKNPDSALQVNARTVNVETGAITRGEAFSVQGKFSQLFDLQILLAQQFISALGVEATGEEAQKMKERETESLAAYRLYILGMQHLDEGKYAEAKKAFYEAYKPRNFPAAKEGFAIASELEIEQKEKQGVKDETARASYEEQMRSDASRNIASVYYLGRACLFNGKYDEAIKHYQTFLEYTQNKVLRWKYQTKSRLSALLLSKYSPLVSDGVVYVVDDDALYALESKTGRLLWKVDMAEAQQPVIADGILYVSETIKGKGILYALDAKTGSKFWQSELGVRLGQEAIVAGDIVYVWSNNPIKTPDIHNSIYALSRANGALLWKHDVGASGGYLSPMTVSQGIVYVLSTVGPRWDKVEERWRWANFCTLSALDGTSGQLLWKSELQIAYPGAENYIEYAPLVFNGLIYVRNVEGYLHALSDKSGQVQWRSEVKCSGYQPVISDDIVYVPSNDGLYLYLLDAKSGALSRQFEFVKKIDRSNIIYSAAETGNVIAFTYQYNSFLNELLFAFSVESGIQLWQYRVAEGTPTSFSLFEDVLYFTGGGRSYDHSLYALDVKSGRLLWKYHLGFNDSGGYGNLSNPTVTDGLIYVYAGNTLYALGVSGSSPLTAPSDLDAQVAIGRALWLKGDMQGSKSTLKAVVEAKPNVTGAWVLLAEISERLGENADAIRAWGRVGDYASPLDEDYQKSLQRLGELAGLRWRFKPQAASTYTNKPVVVKNKLYVQHFIGHDDYLVLYILESETGKVVEKHEDAKLLPYLVEGIVYFHQGDRLYAIEAETAKVIWTYEIHSLRSSYYTYAYEQTILVVDRSNDILYALSVKNGELLWKSKGRGVFISGFNGVIYTSDWRHLNAISAKTGELLWAYEIRKHYPKDDSITYLDFGNAIPSILAGFAVSQENVYVAACVIEPSITGRKYINVILLALDRTTGVLSWKYETGEQDNAGRVKVGASSLVYISAGENTYALNTKSGELLWKQSVLLLFDLGIVTENIIYGSSENGITAIDAQSGHMLWCFKTEKRFWKPDFLSEGILYAGSFDGFCALDAATGMLLWAYEEGGRPIAVIDDVLYLQARDGGVTALDIKQASVKLKNIRWKP